MKGRHVAKPLPLSFNLLWVDTRLPLVRSLGMVSRACACSTCSKHKRCEDVLGDLWIPERVATNVRVGWWLDLQLETLFADGRSPKLTPQATEIH